MGRSALITKRLLVLIAVLLGIYWNSLSMHRAVHATEKKSMPKPYFLLVYSSYENQFDKLDVEKIKVLNESPYHGIAVRLIWEFDDKRLDFEKIRESATLIRRYTTKEIWPWIFLNRVIGNDEKENVRDIIEGKPHFLTIKGMDIYDDEKALTDFFEVWRASLKFARVLSSPGIVFDMEPYNNSKAYKLDYLAERQNKTEEEIERQLRAVGVRLTEIAYEEYPDAIIWFLFTYMGYPLRKINPFSTDEFYTVSYIAEGMISEAERRNLPMKFIDGGEVGLGYCFKSLEDLKSRMKTRQEKLKSLFEKHNRFLLGGTIAPWNDVKAKRGWMDQGTCSKGDMKTIDDFIPFFRALTSQYNYIWIYATPVAGYDPFNKEMSSAFNKGVIKGLKKQN